MFLRQARGFGTLNGKILALVRFPNWFPVGGIRLVIKRAHHYHGNLIPILRVRALDQRFLGSFFGVGPGLGYFFGQNLTAKKVPGSYLNRQIFFGVITYWISYWFC